MDNETKRKIEEILSGIQCPKNFSCADGSFERLCKAKDIGLDNYLKCLDENFSTCSFVLHFGNDRYCRCPLRVFLEKNLKK